MAPAPRPGGGSQPSAPAADLPRRRTSRPPPISRSSTIRSRDSSCSPNGPTTAQSQAPSVLESFEPPELYDHPLSRDNSDDEGVPSIASLRPTNLRTVSGQSAYSSLSSIHSKRSSRRASRSPAPTPSPLPPPLLPSLSSRLAPPPPPKMPSSTIDSGVEMSRSPLFGDHVPPEYLPGSLHHASDESIDRLIARQGAVALVRRLAEDLAMRDRELVALRRRANERERALKKMLIEVEVSHLDIEKRLAACTLKQSEGGDLSDPETLDEMLQQAMSETGSIHEGRGRDSASPSRSRGRSESESGMDLTTPRATLRVIKPRPADSPDSTMNDIEQPQPKGWKFSIWGSKNGTRRSGGSSQAGSVASKRKPLSEDLFSPEMERNGSSASLASASSNLQRVQSQLRVAGKKTQDTSRDGLKSTISDPTMGGTSNSNWESSKDTNMSSWALKLVSGSAANSGKGPSSQASSTNERPKMTKRPSAKDDLQRIMKRSAAIQDQKKRRSSVSSFNGKAALSQFASPIAGSSAASANAPPTDPVTLGPVEMDTILDPAAQPPTLVPTFNDYYPTDYLTDRFGFIYDKRQRVTTLASRNSISSLASHTRGSQRHSAKPSSRDSSSNASRPETPKRDPNEVDKFEAKTPTTWKDLLNYPATTERNHTPPTVMKPKPKAVSAPVEDEDSTSPPMKLVERITRPSIGMPHRQIATIHTKGTVQGGADAETETVKVLLGQLSDLHDSLQRDRIQKWNEFLKKVRAHRSRTEGADRTMLPESMLADGELIGVATVGNAGKGGRQKWKEFRALVLGGIPVDYRWKIWAECSGATFLRVPGYYEDILQNGTDDPMVVSQIAMDINRTLTDNVFFRKGPGVAKLKQVLLAYARRNPAVGYCQGMNMITASLLLIMPTEEDAFWVLVSIIESILPKTYFEQSLLASRADQQVLKHYVRLVLPNLHNHLDHLGVELEALTFQWFLSIFTDCLAAEALFRVWDVLLCIEGSTFLFQTALALLHLNEKALLECETAAAMYSYLNGNMTHQGISIDGLIAASEAMKVHVKRADVEKRREEAIRRELEAMDPISTQQQQSVGLSESPGQITVDGSPSTSLNSIGVSISSSGKDDSLSVAVPESNSTATSSASASTEQSSVVLSPVDEIGEPSLAFENAMPGGFGSSVDSTRS